jgi:hypothetical protein
MPTKKPLIPARLLMPIGLLLVVLPTLINDFTKVPDFFRGLFIGTGIVLEIAGFVLQRQEGKSTCKTSRPEAEI